MLMDAHVGRHITEPDEEEEDEVAQLVSDSRHKFSSSFLKASRGQMDIHHCFTFYLFIICQRRTIKELAGHPKINPHSSDAVSSWFLSWWVNEKAHFSHQSAQII